MNTDNKEIRKQLIALLEGGNAHMDFKQAVADFPITAINKKAPHVPYTMYHLLWHIYITQHDILKFIQDAEYQSPSWPEGYWPDKNKQADKREWEKTIKNFIKDRNGLKKIVKTENVLSTTPYMNKKTILREILIVCDHTAYHIGELAILRQVLNIWPANRKS